jgi:hypothetical protein
MYEMYSSTSSPVNVNLQQHPKDSSAWNMHIVCKFILTILLIT